ncbi:translation initiation factor IF-2 [Candidatus Peregrinibacteria bacterium]|nr:translation initiation factor IF-2 [Candidatus Peregrinibacteria bacterium]
MHLAEIARELRITTQELRRELAKTNFGISPTAHEVEDALAKGVIRFLKDRIKPTLTHRRVAVIYKEGREPPPKAEKAEGEDQTKGGKKKTAKKDEKAEAEPAEIKKEETPPAEAPKKEKPFKGASVRFIENRSTVPKESPQATADSGSVRVSRRIELGAASAAPAAGALPHTYYKAGKKKGKRGRVAEEERVLETMRRHPQQARKLRIGRAKYDGGEGEGMSAEEIAIARQMDREAFRQQKKNRAVSRRLGPKAQPQIKPKSGVVEIPAVISLKEFAEKCGIPVTEAIATLFKSGIIATINQKLDFETAAIVAAEHGVEVKSILKEAASEDLFAGDIKKLLHEEDKGKLKFRPPIISVMGHVDHGKTKILDYIRKTNIVDTESGGITQHIGAYQVEKNGQFITFLDTPGHEAFTSMRARGAKATDIAILVVAADEGVKPQTVEAIHHAQEAGIPIIVAINKIDKPAANPEKVKTELLEHGLQPEEWGGKTIMVPVSAITGEGMDKLLEMILLVAEMEDLKANPNRLAVGTVVEAHLDKSLGPVATILINTGTLNIGDNIIIGSIVGRVKAMHDYKGKLIKKAPPSMPVRISGLPLVPQAGDIVQAYRDEKTAKAHAAEIQKLALEREMALSGSMVDRIVSQIHTGQMKFLKLVLKADTNGSLEAIMQALSKVKSEDVAIKVIHYGVGNIADTDVIMAAASQALVIGFHVTASPHVQKLAEMEHVDIRRYKIIYKLTDEMRNILSGMLEPEIKIIELGKIQIKQIFLQEKTWVIVGGVVAEGKAEAGANARLTRGGEMIFETKLESLKHVKQDVRELEKGSDCGVKIKTLKPVQEGDVLELYKVEKIERTLEE